MMNWKQLKYVFLVITIYFTVNSMSIYNFSKEYSETNSDVGIVLGAGTNNGIISPIFKERINHSIYLYKKNIIKKIIFTGGVGENQQQSDSYHAKIYALHNGVLEKDIFIEEKSRYTRENVIEAQAIMISLNMKSALIISDPLHMKRATLLARRADIHCKPSPTKTTMYRSNKTRLKSLLYESFFYSIRLLYFGE